MTICESCGVRQVPEDNESRVCAFQIEIDVPVPDYNGAITCNCCDLCRGNCMSLLRSHGIDPQTNPLILKKEGV